MDQRRQHLLNSLMLLAVTCAIGFGIARSPIRAVFALLAGLALFGFLILRRPRSGPIRWGSLLVHIAIVQFLAIILFTVVARIISRIVR